jgi:amidase
LIFFGKTNVPEFGLVPVTEPQLFGLCRNPWDLNRTPGGSSGGAAAAVAAGIVPMAHASDGGGSIRIPASCCGLFGLKPSRGLNPRPAQLETITEDFGVDHVISRTVRDSAAALDATCGRPGSGYLAGLDRPPGRLRIGVVRSAMLGKRVAPEVERATEDTVSLLKELGHEVEDAEPQVDYRAFRRAFLIFWAVSVREILDQAAEMLGRKPVPPEIEAATWGLANAGGALSNEDTWRAGRSLREAAKAFAAYFERFDIMLSPALARPPLIIGENRITSVEKLAMRAVDFVKVPWLTKTLLHAVAARSFAFAAFTAPFNTTGQPAMSVPLHWTPQGIPIGMQFAAKFNADGLLLRLARQLELAQNWTSRRPPVWSGDRISGIA